LTFSGVEARLVAALAVVVYGELGDELLEHAGDRDEDRDEPEQRAYPRRELPARGV